MKTKAFFNIFIFHSDTSGSVNYHADNHVILAMNEGGAAISRLYIYQSDALISVLMTLKVG